ncbi:UNC93-like protein MFSD11 [Diaphorina citri]|uniref:UNC93-like protein MFSD11 n=1 Tax=Diaphorina citri TaxID=121845 RepID=A0A1S3CYN2_DIACI|nr:UNC93-like protein MFSD11 [Diaphorina citri]
MFLRLPFDRSTLNVIFLGICFAFIFTAYFTLANLEKILLYSLQHDEPSFTGDGFVSQGLIYAAFSVCLWLAPSVNSVVGPKITMVMGVVGYESISGNLFIYFAFLGKKYIDESTRQTVIIFLTIILNVGGALLLLLPKPDKGEVDNHLKAKSTEDGRTCEPITDREEFALTQNTEGAWQTFKKNIFTSVAFNISNIYGLHLQLIALTVMCILGLISFAHVSIQVNNKDEKIVKKTQDEMGGRDNPCLVERWLKDSETFPKTLRTADMLQKDFRMTSAGMSH